MAGRTSSKAYPRGIPVSLPEPPRATLPTLPVEALGALCSRLALRERVALTTCCKRLTRPEVLSSPGVWGELSLFLKPLGDPGARRQQQLLPPWLAKRRAGLRKLWVFGADAWDSAQLAALLSVLEGGQLADLVMVGGGEAATPRRPASAAAAQDGSALEAALAPLQRLPALQRVALQSLGLSRLPAPLSGLRQLAELDVRGNAFQHEGAPALPPLRHLRALTRLNASRCGLARLPTQLPLGLRDLSLRGSRFSGGAEFEASLHPLPCPGLTRLDLAGCGMATLFPQVSALRSLEVLELQGNPLGQGWDSGFGPLKELRLLTRLDLSEASLPFLPTQLSLLTRLADLRLPHNRALGGAATGLGPLQTLSGLTRLDLADCGLRGAPLQLESLTALAELSLWHNPLGEGGDSTLDPLRHLTQLTSLGAACCGLRGLPPTTALPPALRSVDLSNNPLWRGEASGLDALLPLASGALVRVDLSGCYRQEAGEDRPRVTHHAPPPAMAGLRAKGVQVLL